MTDTGDAAKRNRRWETGANMAGTVVSVTAAVVIPGVGPYVGAIAGPAIASTLKKVAADVAQRQLSEKERLRVEEVSTVAHDTIQRNLAKGSQPRADWYRSTWPGEPLPDDAAEISEGVLIAAQREHEFRKVAILGRILGNLAFTPQIDRDYANALIRTASELSYRQFCLLVLFNKEIRERHGVGSNSSLGDGSGPLMGILAEVYNLYQKSMIQLVRKNDAKDGLIELIQSAASLAPARLSTMNGPGGWLIQLGELSEAIPVSHLEAVARLLDGYDPG